MSVRVRGARFDAFEGSERATSSLIGPIRSGLRGNLTPTASFTALQHIYVRIVKTSVKMYAEQYIFGTAVVVRSLTRLP